MSDSHGATDMRACVAPAMELVYECGTPEFRGQWPRIEEILTLVPPLPGHGDWDAPYLGLPITPRPGHGHDAWLDAAHNGDRDADVGAGVLHDNPAGRLAAMEQAGVARQLISPGPSIDACIGLPSNIASGILGAYNRYIIDYCAADPQRLGAVLQVHGLEPPWSSREILDLADEPGVAGVSICLPVRISPEERSFLTIWAALEESSLPLVHRQTFSARVWTPTRLLNYLRLTGVLERFPGLRIAFLDSGPRSLQAMLPYLDDGSEARADPDGRIDPDRVLMAIPAGYAAEWANVADTEVAERCLAWESTFPLRNRLDASVQEMEVFPEPARRRMLAENPRRFLRS